MAHRDSLASSAPEVALPAPGDDSTMTADTALRLARDFKTCPRSWLKDEMRRPRRGKPAFPKPLWL